MAGVYPQRATLWRVTATVGDGSETYALPALIDVFWRDVPRTFHEQYNTYKDAKHIIYTLSDISPDDWIVLGDSSAQVNPKVVTSATRIQTVDTLYSVDALEIIRRCYA